MLRIFNRYFYALDSDKEIDLVCRQCPQCAAIATIPQEVVEFTTSESLDALGTHFACDILQRARQFIFILRDCFSSYTITKLIPDQGKQTIKATLIETTAEIKSSLGCTVRVDNATAFQSLIADPQLPKHGISLELGRTKNRNKNPIAEKGIQELEHELKREYPEGGPITPAQLAVVTATLNARVRNRGLSAKEIVLQRDTQTGEQLNFSDIHLASKQHENRKANHGPSAISQAPRGKLATQANVSIGDLVYIKSDGDKHTARDKYMVTAKEDNFLIVKKLVGSQFRAKMYKLKFTEVYPVPTTSITLLYPPSNPNISTDPYASDSDSDTEQSTTAMPHIKHHPVVLSNAGSGHLPSSILQPAVLKHVQPPSAPPDMLVTDMPHESSDNSSEAALQQPVPPPDHEGHLGILPSSPEHSFEGHPNEPPQSCSPNRPRRTKKQPAYLKDFVV
jgi:hypothetical protein